MEAKERLYLTADRKRLVREGDAAADILYAAPGDEIPEAAAKQFGVVGGKLAGKGKDKMAAKGEDKSANAPAEEEEATAGGLTVVPRKKE